MFIQYFKKVVVNALLISFEMDLRTWIDFKNEMLIKVTILYNTLKSGVSTITKHKSSGG
jgi:hypothetical protein